MNSEQVLLAFYKLSRSMRQAGEGKREGLSMHNWFTLHLVAEKPLSLGQLAKELQVTPPTASNLIENLVEQGLVERVTLDSDRRTVQITVTKAGRKKIDQAKRFRADKVRKLMSVLDQTEQEEFARLLNALADRHSQQTEDTGTK